MINSSGKIDDMVSYNVSSSFGEMRIVVGSDMVCSEKYDVDLKLPEFLTRVNSLITIGTGVESLILEGNEKIDLS